MAQIKRTPTPKQFLKPIFVRPFLKRDPSHCVVNKRSADKKWSPQTSLPLLFWMVLGHLRAEKVQCHSSHSPGKCWHLRVGWLNGWDARGGVSNRPKAEQLAPMGSRIVFQRSHFSGAFVVKLRGGVTIQQKKVLFCWGWCCWVFLF